MWQVSSRVKLVPAAPLSREIDPEKGEKRRKKTTICQAKVNTVFILYIFSGFSSGLPRSSEDPQNHVKK
jgi:hypothetical protein